MKVLDLLREPSVDDLHVDGGDRLVLHQAQLEKKRLLRQTFREFHYTFRNLDEKYFGSTAGVRIELGAGVAPVRDTFPDVLATDIVASERLDFVLDAEHMNLGDSTVRALYAQNCFHHFADPAQFFLEVERVVAPGGGVILIEPYFGPLAQWLFKRLFSTEGFDPTVLSWRQLIEGPMSGANQALSYVVFFRDRALFRKQFPALEIVETAPLANYLSYLLSGGLNFRQLWPNSLAPVLQGLQWLLSPFDRWLALHHVIVLRHSPQ